MKKEIIIAPRRNEGLTVLNYGEHFKAGKGKYRVIVKCKAGFVVSSQIEAASPVGAFRNYKAKAIKSIALVQVMGNKEHDITVYARAGKKVWACEDFLSEVTVGDINQELFNTALYSQTQYSAVNAKSWECKAYIMNELSEKVCVD